MNELSPAARAMLARGRWHSAERRPGAIIERISRAGRPWFPPIVDFQARYGGLAYVARSGDGFHFDLFLTGSAIDDVRLSIDQDEEGAWYYEIGTPRIAQIYYGMRQDGVVCSGGDEGLVPIASSIEKYIENDAVGDEMLGIQQQWWQLPLGSIERDDRRLDAIVAAGREVLQRASDEYTTWWEDGDSRVRRGVAHDAGPSWDMANAYFRTRAAAESFVGQVSGVIVPPFDIYHYP
jgi:hypothetical protein